MDRRLLLALAAALACSPGGIGGTGEELGDGSSETGSSESSLPTVNQSTKASASGREAFARAENTGEDEGCEFVVPDEQVIADLDAIVAGTLAWFAEAHPLEGLDGDGNPYAPHRCPHPDGAPSGISSAEMTPALTFDCNGAADGLCVPWQGESSEMPSGANSPYYDARLWFFNEGPDSRRPKPTRFTMT